ncbi:MAG: DUF6600 domain-containing protein [Burkholderiaceae bacterium]
MDTLHPLPCPEVRRWRHLVVAGVFVAACLAGASAHAQDDPPARVGRVADITGEARTIGSDGVWTALVRNQPLSTGDRVTTDKTGRATLQFGSTVVRVGADTGVVLTQLDDQKIRLRFEYGQLAVRVRSDDVLGELFIDTDEGAWVPHHQGQYRFDRPGVLQMLSAQAGAGDLLLEAPDSSLPVAAPQRAQVWRTGAQQITHYRMVPALKDAFGDAALAQDKADDKQAAVNAAMHLPPEMTGAADLARFGAWSRGPDGADAWTPAKLPAGWQPFQQGAWSWSPPWGWTWIDDQPWGFAPSHYGRWLMLRGHWAWTPGRWGTTRPVYAPATVGWFGGPALTVDDAAAVGWVALAPDEPVFPGYAVSAKYWAALNDASVAPAARRAAAINGRARLAPAGPLAYANRGVPGALNVVAAAGLLPHVPVSTMSGVRGAALRKPAFVERLAKATSAAPPAAPVGRGALSPSTAVVQVPVSVAAPAAKSSAAGVGVKGVVAPTAPVAPPKPVARMAGLEIAKPGAPTAVAPAAVARPTLATTSMSGPKAIAAPAPVAPIAPIAPIASR